VATRRIKLEQDNYNFPTNNALRAPWIDLNDDSSLEMIGQIMAYVKFHEYLIENIRNETQYGWKPIWVHVGEGLYKTAILHYVSIVELVLFTVAEQCYRSQGNRSPDGVRSCFKKKDRRYHEIAGKEIQVELNQSALRTKLYGCEQREVSVNARDVRLDMLIKAGLDLGLYEQNLADRLSKLNDLRNGIHLRKQALLRKNLPKGAAFGHVYTRRELEDCKICVEDLRQKLIAYRKP
jgi:hypothetical protein